MTQIIVKHMIVNIVSQVLGHFHAFGCYSNTASHASHCIGITTKRNGITNCRSIRISLVCVSKHKLDYCNRLQLLTKPLSFLHKIGFIDYRSRFHILAQETNNLSGA